MASISSTSPDKSPKGTIDTPIIPLLSAINNHPSFFTTSSCSGRISIFSHPPGTPKGGSWAFISHEPADPTTLLHLLFPPEPPSGPTRAESTQPESAELLFRFEPMILAVECWDVGSAHFLVSLAISCGFRESGITSVGGKRVIVAIRCSIRLEVPLGCVGEVLVSREYLRFLVGIANDKMGQNWKRIQEFMEGLRRNGFSEGSVGVEDRKGGVGDENGGVVGEEDFFEDVSQVKSMHLVTENDASAVTAKSQLCGYSILRL
ncbi:hypothetical protein RND81_10G010900 [Saponaria officinalis]|uniref:tRNA(Phe) 7-[(3-amino-3-carboxypropyl)-4-demethylwyosine(37)-N(4)]-methyltransferase n=1 Tax=Saponaria officinalis TaxID=3572 RepID=A0AAW1HZF1_SAPOF